MTGAGNRPSSETPSAVRLRFNCRSTAVQVPRPGGFCKNTPLAGRKTGLDDRRAVKAILAAIAGVVLSADMAAAQTALRLPMPGCAGRPTIETILAGYQQRRDRREPGAGGGHWELWRNARTGTWTVLWASRGGETVCIVALGRNEET